MSDNQSARSGSAPWHLWVVGVMALLWNASGVFLWAGSTFAADAFLEGMPAAHRDYVSSLPFWSTLTWGLGVVGGLVGAILLLLRSRFAVPAFAASLFGAIANTMVYITNPPPEGFFNLPLTLFIVGFALFQLWFASSMQRRGVLHSVSN
ncbi:hypothetical protein HNQ60_000163 [Povalibacter uvarum]|uniref:Sugar transporter n=1 Tax=Povalibacter uvarum TaxID=732238 RepID=A0A841HEN0_9GAMM|nr:hypothetical protein [Povalibacter uvarum]MBB6091317.1 hypothetical protein [Povalibacter uvarum]